MTNNKIAAVVVTFNRLELLKKVIENLRKQTRKLDAIIVVNNSSTDGTELWLQEQNDLTIVKQANLGSSGGQYTGFKTAYDMGFDFIWAMDDDVYPDSDCLEKLIPHIKPGYSLFPIRITSQGTPLLYETKKFNMSNPFKSIWEQIIDTEDIKKPEIEIEGPTFEGPFMSRELIQKIGLPEKKFFIYADDTEYFIRAAKFGFKNILVTDAKLNRMIDIPENETIHNWKHFYILRNIIAIDVLHGNIFIRIIRPFGYFLRYLTFSKNFSEVITSFKAFFAGYFYKSEN
jgi:GT2 family glycosyltransferase